MNTKPVRQSRWLDLSKFETASGKFPLSVSLLTWAYNEEESVVEFLKKSKAFMDELDVEYEHIFIDDKSKDRTLELAKAFKPQYPQLKIIENKTNMNCGWNTRIAVQNATKDVLFWQTADWAYDISRLKEYLWLLKDYDVVQGVRTLQNESLGWIRFIPIFGRIEFVRRSDNLMKAVISVTNYLLIRYLYGVPLHDFQNVTLYPTKLAQAVPCETSTSLTNPELIMNAYWMKSSIVQVPLGFMPRQKGEAKGTKFWTVIRSIRQVFGYWFRWIVLGKRVYKGRGSVYIYNPKTKAKPSASDFSSSTINTIDEKRESNGDLAKKKSTPNSTLHL